MHSAKAGFVAAFITLLLLPPLETLFPLVHVHALEEKRRLADFPNIADKYLHGDGRVSNEINAWFDDHIGFRPLLVRLKHQIDCSIFGYSDKVLIGRDGWLFAPDYLRRVVQDERGGEANLQDIESRFVALAKFLAARQIRLVILANPMKETIYPQFLPLSAPHIPATTEFQKLRNFLQQRHDWIYVDGQGELPKCGHYRLFWKHDIHMNPPGPYCLAKVLVDRIAADQQESSPWAEHFTFKRYRSYEGDLNDFLAVLWEPSENSYIPDKEYTTDQPPPQGYFEPTTPAGFRWIYHTREPFRSDKLPTTVLFGNSFSDRFVSAGIFLYFKDFYRGWGTGKELDLVLPNLPPHTRYFIFQFFEPLMGDLLLARTLEQKT